MASIRLLLDEDVRPLLADVLTGRGYDAVAVVRIGLAGTSDPKLLEWAVREDRAILSLNVPDYVQLAKEYALAGKEHAGIIVSAHAPFRMLLAKTMRLLARKQADDLRNTLEWLHNYR